MKKITRRDFIKQSSVAAVSLTAGVNAKKVFAANKGQGKKVIVIGFDGMDPRLCQKMMDQGRLPNLEKLRKQNGYRVLGTSNPPQSPVAWANFINGADPGSHGIFDFIHRDPERQAYPFMSTAETVSGDGYVEFGDHKLQFDFWPFNHKPSKTVLKRAGTPFWDYLDKAGIKSTFYDLPSNYPPSPSKHGNHKCLSGMGTPDMLGTYGTYQHFSEDGKDMSEGGGKRSKLTFTNDVSSPAKLIGPKNTLLKKPEECSIEFVVQRDSKAKSAVIEIQGRTIILKEKEWSNWIPLNYKLSMPAIMPDKEVQGICRFYVQEISPNFRLYATPINADPANPGIQITEPPEFSEMISQKLDRFYTTGFQEDHKALSNGIFTDEEYVKQAEHVLWERINLFNYALDSYDDGLLFFYFSSTDMQAHMLWWDTEAKHPYRSDTEAKKYFNHLQELYTRMDKLVGSLLKQYGDKAHIMIMSDHGFANFKRQFSLNTWLLENGYIGPSSTKSILSNDVDWSKTRAFGLGINGLYLNLKGRERYGVVSSGREREELLEELVKKLEAVRDTDGRRVIIKVHRTDRIYTGSELKYAPDLIVGYARDFRGSWKNSLGDIEDEIMSDNGSAWAADHCMDSSEVPGVLFSNRPITSPDPSLIDLAPSILTEFGLKIPSTMTGKNIFKV